MTRDTNLGNELALPKFAIDQRDIPMLIKLGTPQLQIVTRLDNLTQAGVRVVQEAWQWRELFIVVVSDTLSLLVWPQPPPEGILKTR